MIVNPYWAPGMVGKVMNALDTGLLGPHLPRAYEGLVIPLRRRLFDVKLSQTVNARLSEMLASGEVPLFCNIKLETINRCNGTCPFCAANVRDDKRPFRLMEKSLFESIVEQLGGLGYDGLISMYVNNEPLLDERVYEFCGALRRGVPKAFIYMFTNGSLLTVDRLRNLMGNLDGMIINSYDDNLRLSAHLAKVALYAEGEPDLRERVFIYLRRKNEIRTNRGGTAPNRRSNIPLSSRCLFPFQQMVVRPDGRLSLCCCDVNGAVTLGDLNREGILEAWHGERYSELRRRMLAGRGEIPMCRSCDGLTTLLEGVAPHPMMRPHGGAVVKIGA